jgi:hypothetical protein
MSNQKKERIKVKKETKPKKLELQTKKDSRLAILLISKTNRLKSEP